MNLHQLATSCTKLPTLIKAGNNNSYEQFHILDVAEDVWKMVARWPYNIEYFILLY